MRDCQADRAEASFRHQAGQIRDSFSQQLESVFWLTTGLVFNR